ncbi:hypothetical protein F441_18463, partial [Phytophthora nicotianae CJ01A1]
SSITIRGAPAADSTHAGDEEENPPAPSSDEEVPSTQIAH